MHSGDWPDHLFALFEAAGKQLADELEKSGPHGIPKRGSLGRLLQLVPAGGARQTELAQRAGITKQSLGELVTDLERDGLVELTADPTDGRARIVRRTAEGDATADRITAATAAVEREWRARVGARRFDTMKDVLREIGSS